MSDDQISKKPTNSLERREFIKRAAVGAGAVAMGMVAMGCSSSGGGPAASGGQLGTQATLPTTSAWKFAVMGDTQWIAPDDGLNPNTAAIGLITQLNSLFIAEKVKFVVQVGDLADSGNGQYPNEANYGYSTPPNLCEDTRAIFTQSLYSNGIGFFPVRGNHDDLNTTATEFVKLYPQTQNGTMNVASAYTLETSTIAAVTGGYPDAAGQPLPAASGSTFTVGKNFAFPPTVTDNLDGLSYAFDYLNARLVLVDQFTPKDSLNPDGTTTHTLWDAVPQQQGWINTAVSGKAANGHAFVFAHKGIITQQHIDVLFGDNPSDAGDLTVTPQVHVASNGANNFILGISQAGARMFFCGHDHMHNRSIVKTTAGTAAQILHQLCQSVSSKFYTPNEDNPTGNGVVPAATSNDAHFCGGQRQTQLSQELYTVGFYIVTVDGANVTVDYYSAPAYPTYGSSTEDVITATPALNFTKQESYGYGLNGKEFLVASGGSYTGVQDTGPSGTVAKILGGTNSNANTDRSGRIYYNDVNTGWVKETAGAASDILVLWGMARNLGSPQTDVYVLSMAYDAAKGSSFVLATTNDAGVWVNAVDQNTAGTKKLVNGPWKSGYPLGTYGIDTTAKTVWAVLNYNGYFAAVTSA